jgi:hypothetical protein
VALVPPDRVVVTRAAGPLTVPIALCASITLRPVKGSAGGEEKPGQATLLLTNGDRIAGAFQTIKDGKILLKTAVGPLSIDLQRVAALRLPPPGSGVPERKGDGAAGPVGVVLDLTSGERIAGIPEAAPAAAEARPRRDADDELRLRTPWGAVLAIPLDTIAQLTVQNGRFRFLSDLRPVEARQTPYLDLRRPHRVNESQAGGPLQLGGTRFSRGLGVHARSDLTYELAGGFKTFAAVIGVDAAVGSAGSVIFRVLGDDKVLFESPVMHGGEEPRSIRVDVRGALLLRLVVDFADNGDLGDHADWANAHLLR